ncbi:MAG: DAK2 domain-containing protein [bacterium]|nr:DAK2 domain-containing protein [bacterium]
MNVTIGGSEWGSMILCAAAALNDKRESINKLNVFPVPDGDTGTNMSLTMASAAEALRRNTPAKLGEAADLVAGALLRGARGNSGVILSLLFRGAAKSLKGKSECTVKELAAAMSDGVDAAYKAVMKPAEGTILTVSRVAATAAVKSAKSCKNIEALLSVMITNAEKALELTVEQNPVLKKAGVVDAGGKGYVTILRAMLECLEGTFVVSESAENRDAADFSAIEDEEITFTYCTEFIVARESERDPALLRAWLDSAGDSLVFVEDDEIIKVHVHTDQPGQAITEALRYGALQTVKIENMRNQHSEMSIAQSGEAEEPEFAPAEKETGFVTVCAGEGLRELFASLGADRIVTGGQTMNPSTEDILREVNRTPAETVFVLPNNKNIIMAAQQCIPLTEKKVVVVPTATVPQGIAALAYRDPEAAAEGLGESMMESAETVHTALVTYAARDSEFDGYEIHAGEYLALLDGALLGSSGDLSALFDTVNEKLRELDPAVLTVYYGEDVEEDDARQVEKTLSAAFADAEVTVISGGQPVYYYMISAE